MSYPAGHKDTMDVHEYIVKLLFESLEFQYLKAKSEGMQDPVILVRAGDTCDDGSYSLETAIKERDEVVAFYGEQPAIHDLFITPPPDRLMAVVVMTEGATSVHDCLTPT